MHARYVCTIEASTCGASSTIKSYYDDVIIELCKCMLSFPYLQWGSENAYTGIMLYGIWLF